jgi:hypothetical protein
MDPWAKFTHPVSACVFRIVLQFFITYLGFTQSKWAVKNCTTMQKTHAETRAQFHQHSMYSFYARRSQKRKNSVKSSVSFYTFGIYEHKGCSKNVDEIDTWCVNVPLPEKIEHDLKQCDDAKKYGGWVTTVRRWVGYHAKETSGGLRPPHEVLPILLNPFYQRTLLVIEKKYDRFTNRNINDIFSKIGLTFESDAMYQRIPSLPFVSTDFAVTICVRDALQLWH